MSQHGALLQHLNGQNVEFTSEQEKDGRPPLMDTVSRCNHGNLQLDVYRKPSHTAQYLSFAFHYHPSFKESVMSSLVHRAHKAPSGQRLKNEEISHIEKQLEINSYPRFFIKRAANDVERQIASKNREVEDQSNTDEPDELLSLARQLTFESRLSLLCMHIVGILLKAKFTSAESSVQSLTPPSLSLSPCDQIREKESLPLNTTIRASRQAKVH